MRLPSTPKGATCQNVRLKYATRWGVLLTPPLSIFPSIAQKLVHSRSDIFSLAVRTSFPFRTLCVKLHPGSSQVRSPGQLKWPSLQNVCDGVTVTVTIFGRKTMTGKAVVTKVWLAERIDRHPNPHRGERGNGDTISIFAHNSVWWWFTTIVLMSFDSQRNRCSLNPRPTGVFL